MLLAGPDRRHRRRRHHGRRLGGATARRWSPASCPSPSSWTAAGWCCAPTCWAPGRAGSPRSSSRAATTPGSSSPRCPRASAPATPPRRPTARSGSAPADAAAGYDRGELLMMPPTIATLRQLRAVRHGRRGARRGRRRDLTPVLAAGPRWRTARSCSAGRATTSSPSASHGRGGVTAGRRTVRGRSRRMTDAAALPGQPRGGVLSRPRHRRARSTSWRPTPSAMTLDGTNTWIVSEPDSDLAVVIDPGPAGRRPPAARHRHRREGRQAGRADPAHPRPPRPRGGRRPLRRADRHERCGPSTRRCGWATRGWRAGDVITVGGLELRVVPDARATPPTRSASTCPADRAVLTGDTVLGRGTTVVAHPDGRLGDYLDSLRRLRSLTVDDGVHTVLPGHGPVLEDAQGVVEFYLAHRAHRLAQVETAVENGYRTPAEVVAHVYADVDRSLWPAAELSVRAQLEYLASETRPDRPPPSRGDRGSPRARVLRPSASQATVPRRVVLHRASQRARDLRDVRAVSARPQHGPGRPVGCSGPYGVRPPPPHASGRRAPGSTRRTPPPSRADRSSSPASGA